MARFSISKVIWKLKHEKETMQQNWKGQVADSYDSKVMDSYISCSIAIEKCLQEINEKYDVARKALEDEPGVYNKSAKCR